MIYSASYTCVHAVTAAVVGLLAAQEFKMGERFPI